MALSIEDEPREAIAKPVAQAASPSPPSPKPSKKSNKKKRKQQAKSDRYDTPPTTDDEGDAQPISKPSTPSKPTRKRSKSTTTTDPMPPTRTLPLLICSLGNPGATYANTFHSAAHTVLNRLAPHLSAPPYTKDRDYGKGLITQTNNSGSNWTLWQSTSYMNESGKGVLAAYKTWAKSLPDGEGRLVIVHDELEKPLGAVSVKNTQGASAKGHNGLKSVMACMGKTPFVRIGVGIGRPVSRESSEVARYVLTKMGPLERARVEGCVEEVVERLRGLEVE